MKKLENVIGHSHKKKKKINLLSQSRFLALVMMKEKTNLSRISSDTDKR